jgi:uracil-DNA glycosylase family protein
MASHSEYRGAAAFLPRERDLASLRRAAESCRGCDLWQESTQVVFGEGPVDAEIVLVGEQPGDHEDREGHPFVGPAGRVLDDGLAAAGIDRGRVYLTNAVKHFKWESRGSRRLHKKPWLMTELAALTPEVLVLMGAVAAQSLLGSGFSVLKQRGRVEEDPMGLVTVATVHPASILRAPDELRAEQMDAFVADLHLAAELAGS